MTQFSSLPTKIFCLFCLFTCHTALAEGMGKVIATTGTVKTKSGAALQRGAEVSPADIVVTGGGSTVEIKLPDGTIFSVGENSALQVPEKQSATANLHQGTLAVETGENKGLKIVTPVSTVGIRGTKFTLQYQGCEPAASRKGLIPLKQYGIDRRTCKDAKDMGTFEAIVESGAISISNDVGTIFIGQGYPSMGAIVAGLSLPQNAPNVRIASPSAAGDVSARQSGGKGGAVEGKTGASGGKGGAVCFSEG